MQVMEAGKARSQIMNLFKNGGLPVLNEFDNRELEDIFFRQGINYVRVLFCEKDERIIRAGEVDFRVYWVIKGKVTIQKNSAQIAFVGEGGPFGEMAITRGTPRCASAIASEECLLLEIDMSLLDFLDEPIKIRFLTALSQWTMGQLENTNARVAELQKENQRLATELQKALGFIRQMNETGKIRATG